MIWLTERVPRSRSRLTAPVLRSRWNRRRKTVQMLEHPGRQTPHRPVADLGEDDVAQLVEQRGAELQHAVGRKQRQRQHRCHHGRIVFRVLEELDDVLEDDGDADIGDLRQHQAAERKQRTAAKLPGKAACLSGCANPGDPYGLGATPAVARSMLEFSFHFSH
jgi:hypothetical protein